MFTALGRSELLKVFSGIVLSSPVSSIHEVVSLFSAGVAFPENLCILEKNRRHSCHPFLGGANTAAGRSR
jgi:hypothetical protein